MKKRLLFILLCFAMLFTVACASEGDYYAGFLVDTSIQEDGAEIPAGGEYFKQSTKATYKAGQNMPETAENGDTYTIGDYIYTMKTDGWSVSLAGDKTKEAYDEILENIANFPITDLTELYKGCTNLKTSPKIPDTVNTLNYTFNGCTSLTDAPQLPSSAKYMYYTFYECSALVNATDIPAGVTNMKYAFSCCTSLTKAPKLPDGVKVLTNSFEKTAIVVAPEIPATVTDLSATFMNCTQLTTVSTIPEKVDYLADTFRGCTSLTGTIVINANPSNRGGCFGGVNFAEQGIELTGSSTMLDKILATGVVLQ